MTEQILERSPIPAKSVLVRLLYVQSECPLHTSTCILHEAQNNKFKSWSRLPGASLFLFCALLPNILVNLWIFILTIFLHLFNYTHSILSLYQAMKGAGIAQSV